MAGRGRGRGRGRATTNTEDSKPGFIEVSETPYVQPPCSEERLQKLIWALSRDTDKYEVLAVQHTLDQLGVNLDNVNMCIRTLFERCYESWLFSKGAVRCIAFCCQDDKLQTVESTTFRNCFLKQLQALYSQKDIIRADCPPNKWLSCVALLCQSLVQITLPDGSPMSVIAKIVSEVLDICLSKEASDDEIWCAAVQLSDVGPVLTNCLDAEKLNRHKSMVRDMVTEARGPREARMLLINAAEGYASNWRSKKS